MRKIILLIGVFTLSYQISAQAVKEERTEAEIVAEIRLKKDSVAAIQKRIKALRSTIEDMPGWKKGAFGTVGASLSTFSNWYTQATPNNRTGKIGFTFNTFANLQQENYFWRNTLNLNLGWVRLDDRDNTEDSSNFEVTNDVFQLTSLFGWNLSKNFALSSLAEYRTTLIDNFNKPGYLDVGLGSTWTPVKNLIIVIQPLNYNIIFEEGETIYESSLGTKIVADYTRSFGGLGFKTNLSSFLSYETSDLNNVTWTNGLTYTLWGALGIGFDFALRSNKQEALDYSINVLENTDETFDTVNNELQSFWIFGISYSF